MKEEVLATSFYRNLLSVELSNNVWSKLQVCQYNILTVDIFQKVYFKPILLSGFNHTM